MPDNSQQQLLYHLALTMIPGIGPAVAKNLLAYCGSAEAVFRLPQARLLKVPSIGEERARQIATAAVLREAETELKFIEKHGIRALFFTDKDYPWRLKDCIDSPLMLYYKGNANLNTDKVLGIVGTRRATEYGKEMVKKLLEPLAGHDMLIISGLAYGIDIAAHQAALDQQLNTVAVLGHGLHTIYPKQHGFTAKKMIAQGGLLTEFRSSEKISPHNFASRNRIVAGMCDAVVVVESADDGGAILTANIANSYNRDVFALPGKATDKWSKGCNTLIKTNRAQLLESGDDLLKAMNWEMETNGLSTPRRQRELLLHLTDNERKVYDALNEAGELEIDALALRTQIQLSELASLLLQMEINDLILALPGKRFKLL